jgi:CRP-like cAMP-binding protein
MNQVKDFFSQGHTREYPDGQILLYQGEEARDVYYIQSGYVKVYDISVKGEEKVLLLLGPGDIFPLIWTFGESSSLHFFYETLNDVEITVIGRDLFMKEIEKDHAFTRELLQYFVNRTKDLMQRVESIEGTSALHKVGQVLNYLSTAHGEKARNNNIKVSPDVTHQLIAHMSGLTRETVSVQLKELVDGGAVKNSNQQLLVNTSKLEDLLSS